MRKISIVWLILIQWTLAFEWMHSSFPKWADPKFMEGTSKTLEGFAAKTHYPAYADFLTSIAIPHAGLFGQVIRSGELAVGLALTISGLIILSKKRLPVLATWLTIIACFGGAIMNLNFFMASGWASPSSWGLNLIMALIQIILGSFYIKNRQELTETGQSVV